MHEAGSAAFIEALVKKISCRQGFGNILAEGVMRAADIIGAGAKKLALDHFTQTGRGIAYGPKIHGLAKDRSELDEIVETSLQRAGLWDEVKDRLGQPGTGLSGGQQQRLCIARTIAVGPEVILMDEPCSALDPIATAIIEDLIAELREQFSIAIVTHSMQQASRVSQRTAYFHLGDLIEVGPTERIFTRPRHQLTEDYITGRFG